MADWLLHQVTRTWTPSTSTLSYSRQTYADGRGILLEGLQLILDRICWGTLGRRTPSITLSGSQHTPPHHAFILWIALMNKLYTMDILLSHQIINSSTWILYGLHTKTHEHILFQCIYPAKVWGDLSAKTLFPWPLTPWQSLLQWAASTFRKKDFTHTLPRLVLSTVVYYLWYERNNRIFKHIYRTT